MTEAASQDLIARIDRIEQQNRRLRWTVAGLALIGAMGAIAFPAIDAASQGRTLEAERFVLRRADGSLAGALSTNQAGAVNLVLFDKQNRARHDRGERRRQPRRRADLVRRQAARDHGRFAARGRDSSLRQQ